MSLEVGRPNPNMNGAQELGNSFEISPDPTISPELSSGEVSELNKSGHVVINQDSKLSNILKTGGRNILTTATITGLEMIGEEAGKRLKKASMKVVIPVTIASALILAACDKESASPVPTVDASPTADATVNESPEPTVPPTEEAPLPAGSGGESTPEPTSTEEPEVVEPEELTAPEIADTPEERIINLFSRVAIDKYNNQSNITLSNLAETVGNDGQTIRNPENRSILINGDPFYPVDTVNSDGSFISTSVTAPGITSRSETNDLEYAQEVYQNFFKINENSDNEWEKLSLEEGRFVYERVIPYPDGSFDSEAVIFSPREGNEGAYVVHPMVCYISADNPYVNGSCFK